MKKRKFIRITIVVIILILLYVLFVAGYFLRKKASERFCDNTFINGYDVSGKSLEKAMDTLIENYNAFKVEIDENGEMVLSESLSSIGYSLDREQLYSEIQRLIEMQNQRLIFSLIKGNEYNIELSMNMDETVFQQMITASNLTIPRTASQNAELDYDGSEYSIIPEVYGNEFADSDLQNLVKDSVENIFTGNSDGTTIIVDIPESIYLLPEITQDDDGLNREMNIYNKYSKAVITYTFGSEHKTLDWSTIKDWVLIDTDSIDTEQAYNYVCELSSAYDTIYTQRSFVATDGRTITLPSNDYGYRIDKDAEVSQLIADISSNTSVEREPVYSIEGYSRNGRDDINGTYVEVNLTAQHLWFYKNGSLVVESDFVSGLPKDGRETTTGAFPIAYKASPFNLTGGGSNGSDSWDVEVQYWMPFYDGQGLHDASWRTSFGGDIYLTDGSHGCINLPTAEAQIIYENMEAKIPILLYK